MCNFKSEIMDSSAIDRALRRISHEILEKNHGAEDVQVVGIYRRGYPLAKMIADNILKIENRTVPLGSVDITLYRDDLSKQNETPTLNGTKINFDINGKKVVMVDDVLYTGRTARAAIDALLKIGRPKKIQFAVLVDRGHRELPIRADYVGKNVPTSNSEMIKVNVPEYDDKYCVELFTID